MATLYVNGATGSDSTTKANNTAEAPWATVGRAAWGSTTRSSPNTSEAAAAGDTVLIAAGTYNAGNGSAGLSDQWDAAFAPCNNGSSGGGYITFRGVGSVTLQSTVSEGPVIGGMSISYVIWDNFYIDEDNVDTTGDTGTTACYGSDHIQFLNIEIKANDAFGGNHRGIGLDSCDNITIRNCKIYDVAAPGPVYTGTNECGIMTYDLTNSLIEHNEIYNCGSGIWLKGLHADGQYDNIVRYNIVRNCGGNSIMLTYSARALVYQNIVRDAPAFIDLWNAGDSETTHVDNYIVNNNFVRSDNADVGAIVFRATDAGQPGDTFYGDRVWNNIFYELDRAVGYSSMFTEFPTPITFEHNMYHDYQSALWRVEGGSAFSLTQWKASGYDSVSPASVDDDPLFVDAANNKFKLQATSPALELGRTITSIHGSNGETIPAGAYITGLEQIGIQKKGKTAGTLNAEIGKVNGVAINELNKIIGMQL